MRALLALVLLSGCYHFRFEHRGGEEDSVTFSRRVPTYVNGFVGTGEIDVSAYCDRPLHTDLRVTAPDVLLSVVTLLVYTPHTLYVTCARGEVKPGVIRQAEGG